MELHEKLLPFIKEHGIALALGLGGLIFLGYGLLANSPFQASQPEVSDTPSSKSYT